MQKADFLIILLKFEDKLASRDKQAGRNPEVLKIHCILCTSLKYLFHFQLSKKSVPASEAAKADSRHSRQYHPYKKEEKKERKSRKPKWSFDMAYRSVCAIHVPLRKYW